MENLTAIENQVHERMVSKFKKRVEDETKTRDTTRPIVHFWKWISTAAIASCVDLTPAQARAVLKKLVDKGLVHFEKYSNALLWAPNHLEGFEQHKYRDYYCRIGDKDKS